MKRLISSGLVVAFILSVLMVAPTITNGQGAGLLSAVLNRMEKNRQSLKTLRANISVVKYNSQLGAEDNIMASCFTCLVPVDKLRSESTGPVRDTKC